MQQLRAKIFGSKAIRKKSVTSQKSVAKRSSKNSALSSFLNEHSSTLGFSGGWPLPVDPFFSFNLLLSMSGFYYGWILKGISSLFSVNGSPDTSKSKKSTTATTTPKVEKCEIRADENDAVDGTGDDVVSSSDTKSELSDTESDSEQRNQTLVECT